MALGAYSIIRYSNDLNDQRVNLGVIVWHPIDGFVVRVSPELNRVKAIDPRIKVAEVKKQINTIREQIEDGRARRETLDSLSAQFRHGLEVTAPYPARMHSANETADHLSELLVSPVEAITRYPQSTWPAPCGPDLVPDRSFRMLAWRVKIECAWIRFKVKADMYARLTARYVAVAIIWVTGGFRGDNK